MSHVGSGLREALRSAAASVILATAGLNCSVVLVSHNALPRTSSGKMSRMRARDLYLASLLGEPQQHAEPPKLRRIRIRIFQALHSL